MVPLNPGPIPAVKTVHSSWQTAKDLRAPWWARMDCMIDALIFHGSSSLGPPARPVKLSSFQLAAGLGNQYQGSWIPEFELVILLSVRFWWCADKCLFGRKFLAPLFPWDCDVDHPTPLSKSLAGVLLADRPLLKVGLLPFTFSELLWDGSPACSHWTTTGFRRCAHVQS